MERRSRLVSLAAATLFVLPATAKATDGYFSHGYGTKYKAMAGAGVALRLTNPAAMVFVGKRVDLGFAVFNPNRAYTVDGAPSGFPGTLGLAPGTVDSGSRFFAVPSLGANWMLDEKSSLGFAAYGNGGMNTDYPANTFGAGATGVDLSQLFVAPTYAHKLGPKNAIGITAIAAYQRFAAKGLRGFSAFSSDPACLTDMGHDNSFGYGARLGYLGEWSPYFSVGASYQTKIRMGAFKKYAGLFAGDGGFDIPSNWTVGAAVKPTDDVAVAFDVQRINYSGVASVANPMLPNLGQALLGDGAGAGFGWRNMTVYKAGVQWQSNDTWTWRAGYSYAAQPIPSSEVLFNILAPGVMEQHATLGLSREVGNGREISLAIMRAFSKRVSGPNPLEAPGRQTIGLRMDEWEFEVGLSFGSR
jgi:long-chain fatty acid transport protein